MDSGRNKFTVYRDVFGRWRLEWSDADGVIRDARQCFATREECLEAARRLGLADEKPIARDTPHEPAEPARRTATHSILCAHANESIMRFVREALAPARVECARSGYEAIKALNAGVFDAYVLDYWLPDWSGTALCREIRRRDPNVPICIYTRARSEDAQKRALRAGADLFLHVPLEPEALRSRVEKLLHSRLESAERARAEAERVARLEVERRAALIAKANADAAETVRRTVERATRMKALDAYLGAGGTRASFERAWPLLYRVAHSPDGAPGQSV